MARSFDLELQNRWLKRIQDWQRCNISIRQFCKQRHLPESMFFFWRRTLHDRGVLPVKSSPAPATTAPPSMPAFVPLLLAPPQRVQGVQGQTASRGDDQSAEPQVLELVLANGRVLRIPPGLDPRLLAELLSHLEKLP